MCLRSYAILFELVTYSMFLVRGRTEFLAGTVFPKGYIKHKRLGVRIVSAVRWAKNFQGVFWRHVIEKFKYNDTNTLVNSFFCG